MNLKSPWTRTGRVNSDKDAGRDTQYNHQASDDQRASDDRNNHDTPTRRRELALDDVMLRLEVAMGAQEQDQDRDGEKSGAEGFAY